MIFCVTGTLFENINSYISHFKPHRVSSVQKNDLKARQHFSTVLRGKKLPLKFVSFVLQLFHFIMREEIGNVCNKVSVDTVHVTWCGYNRVHIFVAIMNTFLYLGKTDTLKIMVRNSGLKILSQKVY